MTQMTSNPRNDAGNRNHRAKLSAFLACVAVILFGLLANSYQALAQPLLLEKIKEARNRLEGLELNHQFTMVQGVVPVAGRSKGRGRKAAVRHVKHQGLKRDVAVVGLNSKTGELKDFTFTETVLLERKKRPSVKPPQIIAEENDCKLLWRGGSRWGFNRDLLLTCDGKEFVIINLTMWTSRTARTVVVDKNTGRRTCRQGSAEQLLGSYVPYSPELHTPDVAEEGRRYLERAILQALQDLDDLHVTSKTFTDQNLSDLASIDFIHALLVDEHMDPDEFKKHEENGTLSRLIEKYWVEVAINQGSAFRMSVSPAGATGISQFICPTYARILDESPQAKLDPVFVRGMQDHVNAVKASITLFDSDMSSWWTPTVRKICSVSTEMLEDCWAASYNGGPNRLNLVIARRGKDWVEKETMIRSTRRYFASRLKEETYTYLAKLGSIREYLLALEQNAPSAPNP
ncbi:MAG: lytic transglycosylase domain-containing protein [Candidatus Methylomirabilis oxygeniifera]|nr:MAG: lytic transglycosylase domain-containing protein [Candidatus Methylomirabilis oxyfera]